MAVTQYIGARYVPLFADPLEWDGTKAYEPLTIVLYQGASYTSQQAVPAGIDITNETYWALTGNYNAQVEQYRSEVKSAVDSVSTIGTRAQTAATNAASSATAAATSAGNAKASESAAATSATNAANSATAAANSATAAATSATNAANSATTAQNLAKNASDSVALAEEAQAAAETAQEAAESSANAAATSAAKVPNIMFLHSETLSVEITTAYQTAYRTIAFNTLTESQLDKLKNNKAYIEIKSYTIPSSSITPTLIIEWQGARIVTNAETGTQTVTLTVGVTGHKSGTAIGTIGVFLVELTE